MSARLPPVPGEWIDRTRAHAFRFEGQTHSGFEGDVISSALWAANVHLLGRSFKYHRPRGILSMGNHDVNTLMEDRFQVNLRADVTPLREGLDVMAVNTYGGKGVAGDRARVVDKLSRLLPVGFYYKAFHRPKSFAPHWERFFRYMTGLGKPKFDLPRIVTSKNYDFIDVAVIGAGPSGLAAGIAAARAGASVLIIDENARAGGSLGYARAGSDDGYERLQSMQSEAARFPRLRMRTGTVATGYYADHWIALVDSERMTKLRARATVFATGAFEQPAVFRNNDLPGIMFASAAQRLIYRYAVQPMRQAVVLTANREGYEAAQDLVRHGIAVAAIVDLRPQGESDAMLNANFRVLKGSCIVEAIGSGHVTGVRVAPFPHGAPTDSEQLECDGVLMSVGYVPAANLLYQAGVRMRYDSAVEQFIPASLAPGIFAAGRVNGAVDLDERVADGILAGVQVARHLGFDAPAPDAIRGTVRSPTHAYPIVPHPSGKNFVDFDEDLQLKDFHNAAQEGFDNIELMKRYTTVGMGPSQGKHSNMHAVRILARIRNEPVERIGTTTARPFYHPVPLSHLAGRGFHPMRQTPLHARHDALGAVWMQAGNWWRPECYGRGGQDRNEQVRAEVRAVRQGVGLIDVGTLGKMDLFGPDAGEFLERVYTGRFANLKIGMTRYGLMLDEAGVIIDDGVVGRLADQHYYFTTTTTGSATVYRELVRWNTQWGLDCGLVNVTGAQGAVNLAGPHARQVLSRLTEHDLSPQSFPFLAIQNARVANVPCRLLRVGFVGELGFEIHAPAEHMARLWDALMETGKDLGITPFGVEAQRMLRLEKGHVIVGQDTDGLTTPIEANMDWAVKRDKPFFVGQRSLKIVQQRAAKQISIGFVLDKEFAGEAPKECHLFIHEGQIAGRITSIALSETLGQHVGLGFVTPELAAEGTRLPIRGERGVMLEATVVTLPFYDPASDRQKG